MNIGQDALWQDDAPPGTLASRIDELETRLAFLDQAMLTLTENVTALQLQRERDQRHLAGLLDELGQLRRALMSDPASEPPPPHY